MTTRPRAPAPRVPVAGLAARGHDPSSAEHAVVVDLGGTPPAPGVLDAAVRAATRSDAILVGLCAHGPVDPALLPLVAALDLTVAPVAGTREVVAVADPEAEADALVEAVAAHPQAAGVLAGVLRHTASSTVWAALDVESYAYSTLLGGTEFRTWLARRGDRPPPPAAVDPVLVTRTGDALRITLNRPERRNAFGREVRDALVEALQVAVVDDTVTRVVLDGAGPAFCSGGDLDEFGTAPDPVTAHLVRTRAGAARPLHLLADRTEVRVHGACVGAGIELPAFAHRVVARPDAVFRLPEVGMGLIPGAGGTVSIPRRIGRWRTLHLALLGTAVDARTALAIGLVDEVRRPDVAASGPCARP